MKKHFEAKFVRNYVLNFWGVSRLDVLIKLFLIVCVCVCDTAYGTCGVHACACVCVHMWCVGVVSLSTPHAE